MWVCVLVCVRALCIDDTSQVVPMLRGQPGLNVPVARGVECCSGSHFIIFLDVQPGYSVRPRLDRPEFIAGAKALAALHSACFDKQTLLSKFKHHACFWTGEKQDPITPNHLTKAWLGFAERFKEHGGLVEGRVQTAAKTLEAVYGRVSEHLASGDLAAQTLCHGDFKGANLLWNRDCEVTGSQEDMVPLLIDFEWAGPGAAAQDVAYYLVSSAPIDMDWDIVVVTYHSLLSAVFKSKYSLAQLQSDVQLATIEIFKWILIRWNTMTPQEMAADGASYGRVLPTRSIPHAMALCRRVVDILQSHPFVIVDC